jgi:signal transduction histidine kinase/ActR/RegA family two-component response regulator
LLPADGSALVMVDQADGSTLVEAAHGVFAPLLDNHIKSGEGMSQRVITSGEPFVTPDIHQEKDVIRPELFQQVRAVACVPLLAQRQVIGAIWAGRQQAFTASEIRLLTAVSGIAANAIQRATLHEQTRKQADEITQIMQSVPDGVLLLDAHHQILLANPPARVCLALLAGVQVGDRLTRLADQPLEALLTSPPAGSWHELVQDEQMFETVARPLINGPTPTGWVLVLRDVTERRLVQRQLYEQERLAAIGQLAAGIAHDFNNLLAIITLHTDLVLRTSDLNERNQGRLATVQQQVDYAAHMVKQILDFSRRSNLERQPLDLVSLLNKQVELFRRTLPEHVEVDWVCEPDEILVEADATRIQQIIMNLAVNARDALPAGGRFTLELSSLELQPRQEPPAVGMSSGRWARLRATDTGAGIAREHLDRIFEPFFTTKNPGKGTGLGLAQVYGIVAQHGGHITVSSRVGVGTTFTIYLPLLTMAMETAVISNGVDSYPHGHGELVLVVEDNEALRALLLEHLQMWQYRVLEAANGEEGLSRLAEHGSEVALILSDVVMPRLGGVAMFQAVRQQSRRIPFILMSGHSLAEEEIAALQREGLYGWLPKPLDMYRLAHLIAAAVTS